MWGEADDAGDEGLEEDEGGGGVAERCGWGMLLRRRTGELKAEFGTGSDSKFGTGSDSK